MSAPVPDVDEPALDGGGSGHLRADEVCPPTRALAALEVPVGGRCAALARLEDVGVHAEAGRTTRFAPLEAGGLEDLVKTLLLGLRLHLLGSGDDHAAEALCDLPAVEQASGLAEVRNPGVRAGPDEDAIQRDVGHGRSGLEIH